MTATITDSKTWTRGAGPLTTVFTTPDFCQTLYWTDTITPPLSSLICMPPRFQQAYVYSWGYYSPGICPMDYTEGCEFPTPLATTGPENGWVSYGGPVEPNETPRICCPKGYTCVGPGTTNSYSKCAATTDPAELAFAIQVRWQESDLSILETNPTVPGLTNGATATATTGGQVVTVTSDVAPATATPNAPAEEDSAGSENAKKALIGGGMAAGLVISALVLWLVTRYRKRRKLQGSRLASTMDHLDNDQAPSAGAMEMNSKLPSGEASGVSGAESVTELDCKASGGAGHVTELDSKGSASHTALVEMEGSIAVAELPSGQQFYAELPGSMPEPAYYEKPAEGDTSQSRVNRGYTHREHRPSNSPNRHSTLRRTPISATSPDAPSPSSWTSADGTVSDMTERDGRTL